MSQIDYTGKNLGGFRVLRKLGQGGMAVVYKAHEESLNRVVALKVIAQHLSDNPQFITRFQREAQAAAQLSHPNIVQIYAIGEDDGVHYFAMEYVKGQSLGEVIEEEGFLTAGRALPIIKQAAEALAVAHDAGIVHRDIKPANIMLDAAGRVKVADFGIAQMSTETRMTQSGMLVGTPEYISPEQCHGEKLDGRSDIYALGVTLYQILSGRTPFEADTPAALVLQIVEGPVPQVGDLNPTIPTGVQNIVRKMMHVDRNQRFQSAEDLLAALKDADTQPVTNVRPHPAAAAPVSDPTAVMPPTAAAETDQAATEAMLPPTEAMPAAGEAAATPPAPATIAAPPTDAATEAMPAAETEVLPETAAETAPAIPADAAEPAAPGRPSPATEARSTSSQKRSPALGIAAAVVVVVVLALLAWQFLPGLGGDDVAGPVAASEPSIAPAEPGDEATAGRDESGGGETQADAESAAEQDPSASEDLETGREVAAGGATGTEPQGDDPEATTTDPAATSPAAGQAQAQQAEAPTQQAPPPAVVTPARPEPEPEIVFVPPPVNSIVAATSGEYEYVDLVGAWIEGVFADQEFQVVDYPASPYGSMPEAARFLVATTATLVSAQELEYFGNLQMQYTVGLTMRVTDLADGITVAGPATTTIKYTSVNMQQNLEKGTSDLARQLARQVRQLIR